MLKAAGGGGASADGPFALYPATPGSIFAEADAITKQAGDLKALTGGVTAKHSSAQSGVAGLLAGPMKSAPKPVQNNAAKVMQAALVGGGCVHYWGSSVQTFDTGVKKLNAEYEAAAANDFGVTKPSTSSGGKALPGDVRVTDTFNDDVAAAKAAKLAELKKRYAALENRLDAKATKVASMLKKGPDDEKTVLTLFGAGALPILSTQAFPTVDFGKAKLTEEQKRAIGKYLARLGGQLSDPDDAPTLSELTTFAGLLEDFGTDRGVATAFLNSIGPKGLLKLTGVLATYGVDLEGETRGPDHLVGPGGVIGRIQSALGDTLAAGTHETRDSSDLGGSDHVSSVWVDDLLDAGDDVIDIGEDGTPIRYYGYQTLGVLMTNGNYSSTFFNDVANDVVAFEKSYADKHGGVLPWSNDQLYEGTTRPPWADRFTLSYIGPTPGFDPIVGLMENASDHPQIARDFFAQNVDGKAGLEYVDYLLTDRDWGSVRDISLAEGELRAPKDWYERPPSIESLGAALKAATLEGPNTQSGRIVESIVHELAQDEDSRTYAAENGKWDDNKIKSFRDHDYVHALLRDDVGDILAGYIASVHNTMSSTSFGSGPGANGDWDEVTPGLQSVGADFDKHELMLLLADVGKDQAAHDTVAQAESLYALSAYDRHMDPSQSPVERAAAAAGVSQQAGQVLGALDFGATGEAHRSVEEADAAYNTKLDTAFTWGGAALSEAASATKIPLAGTALDQALQAAEQNLQHDHTGGAEAQAGQLFYGGQKSAEQLAQLAYVRNTPDSELPAELRGGAQQDPSQWTEKQWDVFNDYSQQNSTSAHSLNDTTSRAGSGYTNGYTSAEKSITGR